MSDEKPAPQDGTEKSAGILATSQPDGGWVERPSGGPTKVAIVGAGAVGSTMAYSMLIQGVAREVVLYDMNADKVRAEALDLAHGVQFAPMASVSGSDDIEICRDADVVVITAGAKQKPGQSRLDLAGATIDIMRSLVPQLVEVAPQAIYMMVANPVDVVTYASQKISGLPADRFFGSGTVLDTSRLRYLVAREVGVAVQSVHAYVVGEHGDSEVPLWSSASVGGVPVLDWTDETGAPVLSDEVRIRIAEDVVRSAYRIIAGKGATNYAIGMAATRIVQAVLRDEHRVLSISTLLENYEGISDVCMAMPTIVGRQGAIRVLAPRISAGELHRLRASADSVREVARQFGF